MTFTAVKACMSRTNWIVAGLLTVPIILSGILGSVAQDSDAKKIFKEMANYLSTQNNVSATFDADIEVITSELQKIQFTNSGQLRLSRPNKLRSSRTGGYSDVELVFDGTTARVVGRHNNTYAEINAPGSVDQLIDRLRDEYNVIMPGADLLMTRVNEVLMEDVIEAKHVGRGVIDGVECEHLAFRNAETDWQIWIERGPRPIPRKYVITSKTVTGEPQYTLRIKTWATDPSFGPDTFAFKAPQGAKKVNVKELADIDEVPAGVVAGGMK